MGTDYFQEMSRSICHLRHVISLNYITFWVDLCWNQLRWFRWVGQSSMSCNHSFAFKPTLPQISKKKFHCCAVIYVSWSAQVPWTLKTSYDYRLRWEVSCNDKNIDSLLDLFSFWGVPTQAKKIFLSTTFKFIGWSLRMRSFIYRYMPAWNWVQLKVYCVWEFQAILRLHLDTPLIASSIVTRFDCCCHPQPKCLRTPSQKSSVKIQQQHISFDLKQKSLASWLVVSSFSYLKRELAASW